MKVEIFDPFLSGNERDRRTDFKISFLRHPVNNSVITETNFRDLKRDRVPLALRIKGHQCFYRFGNKSIVSPKIGSVDNSR